MGNVAATSKRSKRSPSRKLRSSDEDNTSSMRSETTTTPSPERYDSRGLDDWLFAAQRIVYTAFLLCFLVVAAMIFLFPNTGQLNAATMIFLSVFVRLYDTSTADGGEEQKSTELYLLSFLMMIESLVLSFLNTNYSLTYVLAMLANLILMFNGMLYLVSAKERDRLQLAQQEKIRKRHKRKTTSRDRGETEEEVEEEEQESNAKGLDWHEVFRKFGKAIERNRYYDVVAITLMIVLDLFGFNIVWFYCFAYNEFALDLEREATADAPVVVVSTKRRGVKEWTRFAVRAFYYAGSFTYITLCMIFNGVQGNNEPIFTHVACWILLSVLFVTTIVKNVMTIWRITRESRWSIP